MHSGPDIGLIIILLRRQSASQCGPGLMSTLGHKQTLEFASGMSAKRPKRPRASTDHPYTGYQRATQIGQAKHRECMKLHPIAVNGSLGGVQA